MDKGKWGCYNPRYKQTRGVMNWETNDTHTVRALDGGGGDGLPGDEDQ